MLVLVYHWFDIFGLEPSKGCMGSISTEVPSSRNSPCSGTLSDFVLCIEFGCAMMKLDWLDKAVWICPYPGYNTTVVIGLFEAVPRTLSLILHPRLEACRVD